MKWKAGVVNLISSGKFQTVRAEWRLLYSASRVNCHWYRIQNRLMFNWALLFQSLLCVWLWRAQQQALCFSAVISCSKSWGSNVMLLVFWHPWVYSTHCHTSSCQLLAARLWVRLFYMLAELPNFFPLAYPLSFLVFNILIQSRVVQENRVGGGITKRSWCICRLPQPVRKK